MARLKGARARSFNEAEARTSPARTRPARWEVGWVAARRRVLLWLAAAPLVVVGLAYLLLLRGLAAPYLLSLVFWGLMLGGVLVLGAVGLSLTYGVLRFANFAHGDVMTLGAYAALTLLPWLPRSGPLGPFSFGWGFLVALVVAMAAGGLAAVAVDRVVLRPLRRRGSSPAILAMAALGAAFFVRSVVYLGWGADFRFYYVGARPSIVLPLGVRVRPDQLFILALAVALVSGVYLLLEKTRMGKAMRATADNPELARVSGIDTERVILRTWMLAGALAAAGGVLLGLDSQLRPEMGWTLLLSLFAAVILGGIGNPYGALAGGLILGVVQQVATAFMNPAYAPGIAFMVLAVLLVVRPQGLFGRAGG